MRRAAGAAPFRADPLDPITVPRANGHSKVCEADWPPDPGGNQGERRLFRAVKTLHGTINQYPKFATGMPGHPHRHPQRPTPSQTSWLSPHPVTPYEVEDHSDDGDDQEQVNQPPYRVKCKQTKSPAHSEDNGQSQKHQDLPLRGSNLCRVRLDLIPMTAQN
jgi:hypothetical protein